MKTHLLFICFFISCAINAQDIYSPFFPPSHPIDNRIGNKPELRPDTILSKYGTESGVQYIITDAHYYGDDGYIDTLKMRTIHYVDNRIIACFAYLSSISTYSKENNKLVSQDFYRHENTSVLSSQSFYEYDSAGRRTKEHHIGYSDHEITHDTTFVYDFSTVNHTDSGYIFNNVNYCFDEKNRLKKDIRDDRIITYSYYNDESGYDMITTGNGYKDKLEHFFNKHGLLTKSIGTDLDFAPDRKSILELEYYFSPGNATSNSFVINIPEIYGTTGGLIINTNQPEWIMIYTLSGQLVKKEYINQNQQIPLPKGIYIVKSTNKTFKVVVK